MSAAYDDQNILAKILRGEIPSTKVLEDESTLAIMDIMPRTQGHVLVIPKAPARTLVDIAPDDLAKLIMRVQKIAIAAKQAFDADGITLHQYSEAAGGQSIFHLHFHVMPRWTGVELRPHGAGMEKPEVLAANRDKIVAALSA